MIDGLGLKARIIGLPVIKSIINTISILGRVGSLCSHLAGPNALRLFEGAWRGACHVYLAVGECPHL